MPKGGDFDDVFGSLDFNEDDPIGSQMSNMVVEVRRLNAMQHERARVIGLLDAATRLYPFIAQVMPDPEAAAAFKQGAEIVEADVERALRAVDLAFGMDAAIRARIEKERTS